MQDSAFSSAAISLAVVDDETIHELNRRHLDHDWPTDVLSFVLEDDGDHLEGEVIISADTAAAAADELGCSAADEQLLYVIHGMLHLVGYDDKSDADAQEMRAAEARYLQQFGVESVAEGRAVNADALLWIVDCQPVGGVLCRDRGPVAALVLAARTGRNLPTAPSARALCRDSATP